MMLRSCASCRWLQACLGFILLHFIFSDCPFPPRSLLHGRFVYQLKKDANETFAPENYLLRFRCFSGYMRIGPRAIVCAEDQWTDVVPTCTKIQCSEPPKVEYGKGELHTGVNSRPTIGSTVIYSCHVGYELWNASVSSLTCVLDAQTNTVSWEGEIPVCKTKESCPDPGMSPDGKREGLCCFSGDVLSFSCNEGYELVGEEQIQCLSTGNWNWRRPLCKPEGDHCELPPQIPHGVVKGSKEGDYYRPEDEVEVLCKPGYSYKGPAQYVLCEEEGQWEEEFGNCTEIFCDPPEPLSNGTIPELLSTNLTTFPFNFELTYICDKGFRLIGGDSWRFCDERGWSGKTPYCEVIQCPDPGSPEHGERGGENFKVGAKITFKCSTGYYLLGSFERYCMPNGQWTGELARCDTESNYCPNPGIPINGLKNSTNYFMGDIVGFRCQPGYILLGSESRECLTNRRWTGKEIICLGPYDFDNSAQVRDRLKVAVAEKAEEQKKKLQEFHEAAFSMWHNGSAPMMGRILNLNHPGRIILYFLFDVSGSVGPYNFDQSVRFAKAIVRKVGISTEGARAGALTFSSKAEVQFLPVDYTTTEQVMDALDKMNYTGGGTSASSALTYVREDFIPLTERVLGKLGMKSVVFILTDGRANMGGDPQEEAEVLKRAGVEIYCIGITGDVRKDTLYKIASDSTEEPHVFILENYATFSYLVQEITNGTIDYSQCGLGQENVGTQIHRGRIVGGKKAVEPWPWMAAIYFLPTGTRDPAAAKLECGGSVIHKNYILTAAHCMYATNKWILRKENEIIVKLGITNVKNETYVQEHEVKHFFIHPMYQPGGQTYDYDIALFELSNTIEFNSYVRPICLPPRELPPDTTFYQPNERAMATGWGHEGIVNHREIQKITENLKEIILPIQSRERCLQSLLDNRMQNSVFTDQMFCAGDENEGNDTCQGDSGGPLMQSQLNEEGYLYWTQVGIVSWGIGCGRANTYGYYSHVQRLRTFIDETIEEGNNV